MKKHWLLHLIISYVFLTSGIPLSAQESFSERYNTTYITMNDGLPNNFIDYLYKDSRGFLWIAMGGGGLSRYDGYEFIHFTPSTSCKLKSDFVRYICEDDFQRLWVVSEGGTDIIDLSTLRAATVPESDGKLEALRQLPSSIVIKDSQGCIWLHAAEGLHRIAFNADGSIRDVQSLSLSGLKQIDITFCDVDADGRIWAGIGNQLFKINVRPDGTLQKVAFNAPFSFEADITFADIIAKENEIWIATNHGLFRYDKNANIIKHYEHIADNPHSLSQDFLTGLAVTVDKQLLVASLKGINVYNPIQDDFDHITDQSSGTGYSLLNSNFINCILVEGKHIWLGTESGGINKMTVKRLSIQNYVNDERNPYSLSRNPVNAIYRDDEGCLWVGTVEGGLNKKEAGSDKFIHYTEKDGVLSHNSVSAITTDGKGRLWIGTWGNGLNVVNPRNPQQSPQSITITHNESGYSASFVGALVYDSINNGMWIGANRGLFFYDLKQEKFINPLPDNVAKKIYGCIGSAIDREGQLWIGCQEGVYIIDLHSRSASSSEDTFRYRHLKYKLDAPESGLIEKICSIYEAEDGTLWLGSNGFGLYKRIVNEQGEESFVCYNTSNGLLNNSVRSILEDDKECLWIATSNGLSRFQPSENRFINYTCKDGFANTQFYWNAAYNSRSERNKLYFGTIMGLVVVDSNLPSVPMQSSQICFTRLRADNEEIYSGSEYLPKDISVAKKISLHERVKSFSLEFSALDFEPEMTAIYSYRLLGFDERWIQTTNNQRFVSYTNLSPGDYTLQVKYTPDDETQEEKITELEITIEPYFYKTTWFTLLVILLVVLAVWQIYQWRIRSLKEQKEELHKKVEQRTHELNEQKELLERQKEELSHQNETLTQQNEEITRQKTQLTQMTQQIQELSLDKIAFFTNITHEFRTPITLIIGPIERALKLSYNPQVIEQLHFVERNSKYLLSLVNQLMDFRKVGSGKLEIIKTKNNFLKFANELLATFEVFAKERNITLEHYYRLSVPEFFYDEEAMHKVLTNLLSNAIKFTPNGGHVSLYVALLPSADKGKNLYICVRDAGDGIREEDADRIFNRFFQSRGQNKYPMYGQAGSGIGLYLCKNIVQLCGGSIRALRNHTVGSSFRILIPLSEEEERVAANKGRNLPMPALPTALKKPAEQPIVKGLRILVVEDNADMRAYIRSILRSHYNVLEAADGVEALNILTTQSVDFIISDLMMPVMDGIELSRRVKENFAISHIPFLMLTAKTSQEARLESYRMGVDEYLLKPFDEMLLIARIENILENRRRYQRKFAMSMDVEELNIEDNSGDKKFLNQVMEVMRGHYQRSDFEVTTFCEVMGISKSVLNKKLQSLVGQPAGRFIRNYRLNIARELLVRNRKNKGMNIAEIAYEVGFNDPKYFTRCFTKFFNTPPSSFLNEEED